MAANAGNGFLSCFLAFIAEIYPYNCNVNNRGTYAITYV